MRRLGYSYSIGHRFYFGVTFNEWALPIKIYWHGREFGVEFICFYGYYVW